MYDIIDDMANRISILEAENAELRARLGKAVELPRIIHPNKSEWHIHISTKAE